MIDRMCLLDRPIVFDLRSIVRKYWKSHICVINEALKCCHFYVNYIKAFSNIMILTETQSCVLPTKSVGRWLLGPVRTKALED
jgi:hypothetical protein